MADSTRSFWAVIGGSNPGIFQDDCPHMKCGRSAPALPLAIQCVSLSEAKQVAGTLQDIVNKLPSDPDASELLAAFGNSQAARTLLSDARGFYAVIIGTPPGIHRTSESAARAEGTFKYPIRRHTSSFWEALAFIVVKGIQERMPPLLTSSEILDPTATVSVDVLGESLHNTLSIATDSPSRAPGTTSNSSSPSVSTRTVSTSQSRSPAPIIYSHVRNLHGIIGSRYYPVSTTYTEVEARAQQLGSLAARYLASHGYGTTDVDIIIRVYRHATNNRQFITELAREGMAVDELDFLWTLIV